MAAPAKRNPDVITHHDVIPAEAGIHSWFDGVDVADSSGLCHETPSTLLPTETPGGCVLEIPACAGMTKGGGEPSPAGDASRGPAVPLPPRSATFLPYTR